MTIPMPTRREDLAMRGPIKAHDRSGSVVYLNSFSKSLMPALRIGFVVAPPPLHERLISLRRAGDPLRLDDFAARAGALIYTNCGLKRHLRRVIPVYPRATRRPARRAGSPHAQRRLVDAAARRLSAAGSPCPATTR